MNVVTSGIGALLAEANLNQKSQLLDQILSKANFAVILIC